eukprot:gene35231-43444_t
MSTCSVCRACCCSATAHQMGMVAVAEGVELVEDLALLRSLGCELAQGTLVAAPMPGNALAAWIKNNRRRLKELAQTPHGGTAGPPYVRTGAVTGSVSVKVVPAPGVLRTSMRPPRISPTMLCTMCSPRPEPPVAALAGVFSRTTKFDSLGRPYTITGNNGQRLDLRYDDNGNLLSRTDAAFRSSSYEYHAQNRPTNGACQ